MATLQKIRNNAGLLVSIIIGLALLSFILGDLLTSGDKLFNRSRNNVAEVAGKSITIDVYQKKIDENTENYKRQTGKSGLDQATTENIQEQTWNQMIHDYVMEDELAELGLTISGEELFDMVQGNNIDPQIQQIPIFQNQKTGQFDRALVLQFLKNKEQDPSGNAQASWSAFEKALIEEKINQKYNTLIEKGLFATTIQAKKEAESKNTKSDFDYVTLKYNNVSDSLISFTEKDLQKYYDEHKDKYDQTEIREIAYVTFPVVASEEDDKETKKWIEGMKAEFSTTENNEQYISLNSDVPFDGKYYSKAELPEIISFLYDSPVGTTYGPYKDGEAYKISKVVEFKSLPDSVKARHILIKPEAGVNALAKADSILGLIKKGGNFADLAKLNSADGSASQGGDLGWFPAGAMVKPFNDACFNGKKGDIVTVETQFGAHIVEIIEQSKKTNKVEIATLVRTVVPSSKTYQIAYAKASKFGATNRDYASFQAAAEKEKLTVKVATLKKNDKQVANIENSRSLIRWAYKAEKGNVSEIQEFSDMFLVSALKEVQADGIVPFKVVRTDVEREVKKAKKAAYLIEKMAEAEKNASTLQLVADKLQTQVKEAVGGSFAGFSITGVGVEPEVQAAMLNLPINKMSAPIEGKSGVFIIQIKNIQKPASIDASIEKAALARSYRSRVNYQLFEAIKEASKIEDNRSNFY